MKLKNILSALAVLILIALALHSCKPKEPGCDNCENELITTLDIVLTDSSTGSVSHFIFRDLDGTGTNAPVQFDTIHLLANHTYTASFLILDESKTPADTISNEVAEEANEHAFFFHPNGVSVSVVYLDFDTHTPPLPLGLNTKWYTGAVANGIFRIVLRHQPEGKDGTETPGDTDMDISFPARIQ
jgi:hypothetical protein